MKCTLSGCDHCTTETTTRRRPQSAPAAPPKQWWVEFTDFEGDAYTTLTAQGLSLSDAYAWATGHILPDDTVKPRVYFAAKPRPPRQGPR